MSLSNRRQRLISSRFSATHRRVEILRAKAALLCGLAQGAFSLPRWQALPLQILVCVVMAATFFTGCRQPEVYPVPAQQRWGVSSDLERSRYAAVEMKREGCFGRCPAYGVLYRRDGSVVYRGEKDVDRIGEHRGTISLAEFASLGQILDHTAFERLDADYSGASRDLEVVSITVSYVGGATKTVREAGRRGPLDLWSIQRVLDGLLVHVQWEAQQ